ncbi:serine protease gd-like [Cydia pomonella]|uniref:serine protease gd-like n=1 Tax=Cydia pomonella TaxID=82600 RepID=UPI002ADE5B63|nr:serine protease gd-like [Cydia pomonella]
MCRFLYSVLIVLGYTSYLPVISQYVDSPCPGTFEYQSDGGGVYGVIHLQPNGPVSSIHVVVNFTIAARVFSNYAGRLQPINPLGLQFNQDSPIDYRVDFPVTTPLPRLTYLIVNGNVLCYGPGDVARPNLYVTTISLQHMLFLRGGRPGNPGFSQGFNQGFNQGSNQGFNQFNNQPKPQEPSVNNIPSSPDAQVFAINVDGDRTGTWNDGFQHPQQQPQTQRPPPPQDDEYYLLELPQHTTTTRRPTPPPPRPQTYPSMPPRNPSFSSECGVVAGGNEHVPLIYHGTGYTRGDWPWLVAIYKRKDGSLTFACSGTLVSDRHVVSAAHCVQQRSTLTSIRDIVVKVGVYNLEDWGDDITVTRTLESAIIHEGFNSSTYANDLLVLTFDKSVEFNNNIRPACLWNGNNDLNRIVGASGVVAGWGSSELGPGSRGEPRMVRIPVVSTAMCRASRPDFHVFTSDHTFCAGDRNGAGPCLGDSGGGLYILDGGRWRLRGVVSLSLRPENGESTCNLNEYVIFTDAAKFIQWIKNVISN